MQTYSLCASTDEYITYVHMNFLFHIFHIYSHPLSLCVGHGEYICKRATTFFFSFFFSVLYYVMAVGSICPLTHIHHTGATLYSHFRSQLIRLFHIYSKRWHSKCVWRVNENKKCRWKWSTSYSVIPHALRKYSLQKQILHKPV